MDGHVEINEGILSTGPDAVNTVNQIRLPEGGMRPAALVDCLSSVVALGTEPAVAGLFVGREAELAELDVILATGSSAITQAITGLGGIGKTSLAKQYASTRRRQYNPIWWIAAEEPSGIEAGLAALARRLYPELGLLPDPVAADWGRSWLSSHSGWLLVLDNVTNPVHVSSLIADSPDGRFLVTTRLTVGWEGIASPLRLEVLTADAARELIVQLVGNELLDGVEELCLALGFLPLAIRMAAKYVTQNQISPAQYLRRLIEPGSDVLSWSPTPDNSFQSVSRIWQVSLDRIDAEHGGLPRRLLEALAWLAPDDIPVKVLQNVYRVDARKVDEALGRLGAYALITRSGDAISVHRLVQAVARSGGGNPSAQPRSVDNARKRVVQALLTALPTWSLPSGWPIWRRLIPHIEVLAGNVSAHEDDEDFVLLLEYAALFLQEQGAVKQAIVLHERAIAGHSRILGSRHPTTLSIRNNLAVAYGYIGDYERAIRLLSEVLGDRVRILGDDHRSTLSSRNNLASILESAGDLEQAILLYERTLTDAERILGVDHPETLGARSNLAYAYESAGDLDKAIPLYEDTLADRIRVLGDDHPSTLVSRNNLAHAYQSSGDLDKAIPLHERTLADRIRVLGDKHPHTLSSRNNLANAYEAIGDFERAIPLAVSALAGSEQVLGDNHPDTLISRGSLAYTYAAGGELEKAISLYVKNLANYERLLGNDHLDTVMSRCKLADAYAAGGYLEKAIPLYELGLTGCEHILGSGHQTTLGFRGNLAYSYESTGQLHKAIPLHERIVADCQRTLGENHPSTLISRNNLAIALEVAGDLAGAIALYQAVLGDGVRVLGDSHPLTVNVRARLESLTTRRGYLAAEEQG